MEPDAEDAAREHAAREAEPEPHPGVVRERERVVRDEAEAVPVQVRGQPGGVALRVAAHRVRPT